MKQTSLPPIPLEIAASTFAALGSEQRLLVLRCLVRAGPDGLSIGSLGEKSGVTGSTLTHHLKILTQSGLIHQTRIGRSTICAAVAFEHVQELSNFLLSECCSESTAPGKDHEHGLSHSKHTANARPSLAQNV
jgi:ArsR family transcriptional regulator